MCWLVKIAHKLIKLDNLFVPDRYVLFEIETLSVKKKIKVFKVYKKIHFIEIIFIKI